MRYERALGRPVLAGTLAVALAALVAPRTSEAKSCVKHVAEHFDLELAGVFQGKAAVRGPDLVRTLDELINSSHQGSSVLLWQKSTYGFGKFYKLTRPIDAAPEVRVFIDETRLRRLRTGCGFSVPYAPIVPGEYAFEEEHEDGAKVSAGIDRPSLSVSADRKQVELRFTWRGQQQRAIYNVKRTSFPW